MPKELHAKYEKEREIASRYRESEQGKILNERFEIGNGNQGYRKERTGSYVNKESFGIDTDTDRFETAMADVIREYGPERKGKHSFKIKVTKMNENKTVPKDTGLSIF